MPFAKGKSGNPAGRKKGAANKLTVSVKVALEQAFEGIGGVDAFIAWGKKEKNRADFYRLWGKLAPKPMEVSGTDGGPLTIRVVRE